MNRVTIALGLTLLAVAGGALVINFCPGMLADEAWIETEGRIIEIKYALEDYRADHGYYPPEDEGLAVLLGDPPAEREGRRFFIKHYVGSNETLTDAWGRPIIYDVENGGCTVYSLGRDGEPGGSGSDEDIGAVCHPGI